MVVIDLILRGYMPSAGCGFCSYRRGKADCFGGIERAGSSSHHVGVRGWGAAEQPKRKRETRIVT